MNQNLNFKNSAFKHKFEFSENTLNYALLPFRFERIADNKILVTNEVGEYAFIDNKELENLCYEKQISQETYRNLEEIHIIANRYSISALSLLSLKLRQKYQYLSEFTSLHMMVVTLRCNQSCPYCQVSRKSEDKAKYDMSIETAIQSLKLIAKSPSKSLKIEFQGGESLLNFDLIKEIVIRSREFIDSSKKVEFVTATNLTLLSSEILEFFDRNSIYFSTSLDGSELLHNENRPYQNKNAHDIVTKNIKRIQQELGKHKISALMTTTERSLKQGKQIVDEYLRLGFEGIFLRPLSPFGFAIKTNSYYKYNANEWLDFYKTTLEYIFKINFQGVYFDEFYTTLLAKRILWQLPSGYVDLQSPTGAGIMGVVYDYDGKVYASDEGRMLAQSKNYSLQIGTVNDSFESIFLGDKLFNLVSESILESAPMCSDCAFLPWCGSDPSYHIATQSDSVGHKAFSGFCERQMGIFKFLLDIFENRPKEKKIIESWVKKSC